MSDESVQNHSEVEKEIQLKNGYVIKTNQNSSDDIVTIHAADGKMCIRMVLTAQGPLLELNGTSLALNASETIALRCKKFDISAGETISIRSGGDLLQKAGKNIAVEAEGELVTEAFSQKISAYKGDIKVKANDDVFIDGERVRLNSPRTRPEAFKRQEMEALLERVMSRQILPVNK